ncbi:protein-glucosylgalactosylhydroxylysine glucosidase [Drosophila bipectinata]|uniref:protein-glucosylgalactosylhydroxylysine glucosidase n=1 Tax=Drosophila bipectinata TaxID=42026 RepID=UPI001C8A4CBC|nr:protein-glucosylgalactosylhydroxylysine glucosidase [Drosophila bipectinata]
MRKILVFVVNLLILRGYLAEVPAPYLLQTYSLPSDLNFMPTLGNGHLGYTVYGDAIFMNGVYNGAGGNSKRARIPNWLNITTQVCDRFGCTTDEDVAINGTSYDMNLRDGYFRSLTTFRSLGITLEQRTYPHKFYNRALVYEVVATRLTNRKARVNSPQYLKLTQYPGSSSDAFQFVVVNDGSASSEDYRILRGQTEILEFEKFQPKPHEIFVFFSESLEQPQQLEWPTWQDQLSHRIIITMDRQQSMAQKELQDVLQLSAKSLLLKHTESWNKFWDSEFSIQLRGDDVLELSQIVNAGIFYLASSLPSLETNQENEPFFGLSPTGLGRGNLEADYQGHNFWDTEIWMLPVVIQFGYEYGKQVLDYRTRKLEAAKYHAYASGYKGARFPWESAYTGTEVTNPCCPEVARHEIHISPDISFALQKFFAQSADFDWTCDKAWPIAAEVAEFLVSRAACEELKEVCHFLGVMGPDEDHPDVDDNVYTNAVAKIALDFAAWAGQMCGNTSTELFEKWTRVSNRLVILRDEELNYHPQHLGYVPNTTVKQADTILLGFPLKFDTSSTHLNDLKMYANVTRESGPAMTWSMFAANYLRTVEYTRAHEYFERGYKSYVRPEFKVWSETPIGYEGSANFLTGIGGFLQALIFGYGGLDFVRDGNKTNMIMYGSMTPPNVDEVEVNFIRYGASNCQWIFSNTHNTMNCGKSLQRFEMVQGGKRTLMGSSFNFTKGDPPIHVHILR